MNKKVSTHAVVVKPYQFEFHTFWLNKLCWQNNLDSTRVWEQKTQGKSELESEKCNKKVNAFEMAEIPVIPEALNCSATTTKL